MYPSRRCPTKLPIAFGCCMLLLVLQNIATVQSHALPESVERKLESVGALNLVEAPALALQQPSDSETAPQASATSRSESRARQLDLDRMDSLSQSSASEIIRSKRWKLQKITPPGRSRINNRSMTAFNEMDSGEYSEDQTLEQMHQYHHQPATRHWSTALQVHRSLDTENDDDDYQDESRMIEEARFKKKKKKKEEDEDYLLEALLEDDLSASLEDDDDDDDDTNPEARFKKKKKFHLKHKYKKFLLPLLLAYKLKFMMMFPAIIGGLALLVKAAGLAGFFFALFASVVSLQKSH